METRVGNVKLNYDFYQGEDQYSDGDIEDELLKYVSGGEDLLGILKKDNRWPVLYHLSPVRHNILEWYPFKDGCSVLEVGAGCGAVTGAICKKAGNVVCNDLSKRRSLINANRNREFSNLDIYVGNFNDLKLSQKFDYVTLIGVLEYAGYYTKAKQPFTAFLGNLKSFLKEDGKILIAIENKFGLKYFAGAREDHTGGFFDGIEGYSDSGGKARTFSREGLKEIVRQAGYGEIKFYYPFPDYKFPVQIFSDQYLPKPEDVVCGLECYDNTRVHLFNETAVLKELIKAGKFTFFSNSFFVEAGL